MRRALRSLDLPDSLLDEARLLLSELFTNSVRHAGMASHERVRVRADWSGSRLRVDVWDRPRGASSPVAGGIRPAPASESGWGLYLVDRLATRWGYVPGRYWFEIELDADD